MLRREVLKGLAATGLAGAALPSFSGLGAAAAQERGMGSMDAPFAPVKSSHDRVIRTIVGLRPFRRTGFRLDTQRIGRKDVVHNYGHGGGGVSLAWGVAEMAGRLARSFGRTEIAVMGSGVIGLTTARVLQMAGADVTLYAAAFPPYTTSNIAGAMWHPVSLYENGMATPEFISLMDRASQTAFLRYQRYVNDPKYGIFWIRQFQLRNGPARYPDRPYEGGDALYPGLRRNQEGVNGPFGYPNWDSFYTLMIDPDVFLNALVNDFQAAGGRMVEHHFQDERDVTRLKERTIVNCTGLGAGTLFGDEDIQPARGQLTLLLPQPEIDYGYAGQLDGGTLYMFPRKTCILLGGSFDRNDWDLNPRADEVDRMVAGHAALASRLSGA
ncbi:MAG: FAD-dependent oxidoreductase [Hyphomonas sp.]